MIHNSSMINRLLNLLEHVRRCLYKDNAQFAYFTSKGVYTKIIHEANDVIFPTVYNSDFLKIFNSKTFNKRFNKTFKLSFLFFIILLS